MADLTGATTAVVGLAAIGLNPHSDPGVVIAAFAGSVIFVLSAKEYSRKVLAALFAVSWLAGIIFSDMAAAFINHATPEGISASQPVGALVAAAIVVRVLMLVDSDLIVRWFDKRRGGGNAN